MANNDNDNKGLSKCPIWEKDMVFATFERELKGWRMGTQVKDEKLAAYVVYTAFSGERRNRAVTWLLDNETTATSKRGLDALMAFMKQKTEGQARDVRLNLLDQFFKQRRTDSQTPQQFLDSVEEMIRRLRQAGIDINPTVTDEEAEPIYEFQEARVVGVNGQELANPRPAAIVPAEGVTAEVLRDRLDMCSKYERLFQELLFTTVFYSSRLTHNDQKTILSKLDDSELSYSRLEKEIRLMYPLQAEGKVNSFRPKAHLTRRGREVDDLSESDMLDIDQASLGSDGEESGDDVSEEGFSLSCTAFQAQQAFLGKYNVSFDQKKNVFRVKPKKKASPSKGSGNPIDRKTGKRMTCNKCGSDQHFANKCSKDGGSSSQAKGSPKKFNKKKKGKAHLTEEAPIADGGADEDSPARE